MKLVKPINAISVPLKLLLNRNFFLGNRIKNFDKRFSVFFLGKRNNYLFYNVELTLFLLRKAMCFIITSFSNNLNSKIFFYHKNFNYSFYLKGQKQNMFSPFVYFSGKWRGGLLSNFYEIFDEYKYRTAVKIKFLQEFKKVNLNFIKETDYLRLKYKMPNIFINLSSDEKISKELKNLNAISTISVLEPNENLSMENIDYPIHSNSTDSRSVLQAYLFFFKSGVFFGRYLFLNNILMGDAILEG